MKLWSFWYPDILPHVAGCPIPIVQHELLRSAQDFFTATRAWQVTLSSITISAGASAITIPMDADKDLVRVEAAWYDGEKIEVVTPERLDSMHSDDWRLHTGTPTSLLQFSPGIVSLYPIPVANAVTGLKLRVSVRPSEAATGISDEMAVKFRSEMEVGAKAKLMLYAAKPWTNIDMGAALTQQFNGMMDRGNITAARSYLQGRIAARPKWA